MFSTAAGSSESAAVLFLPLSSIDIKRSISFTRILSIRYKRFAIFCIFEPKTDFFKKGLDNRASL